MKHSIRFAIGLVITLALVYPLLRSQRSGSRSPQVITISSGSFKKVAGGRAEIWLGQVDSFWREDLDRLVDSAQFELKCAGEVFVGFAFEDQASREICGCQVRLVQTIDKSPPSAVLEITWDESTPQSAGIDPPKRVEEDQEGMSRPR